jgi:hypothetical protein
VNGPHRFALIETGPALDVVWPYVRDYLDAALRESVRNELTIERLHDRIAAGVFLLAVIVRGGAVIGAQVFERGTDPQGRRFVASVCTGGFDMADWLSGLVALGKKLCELHEAERFVMIGRRGWERVMHGHGMRIRAVIGVADVADIVTDVEFAGLAEEDHG